MSLPSIKETSLFILIFRYAYTKYKHLQQRLNQIYQLSLTHETVKKFWQKANIYFRYSFLGKISDIRPATYPFLENSRTVQSLSNLYYRIKNKTKRHLITSSSVALIKKTEGEFDSSAVELICVMLAVAITVNGILIIIFPVQIGLWRWVMRIFLLFIVALGIFTLRNWSIIRESSCFLRKAKEV